MQGGVQYECPGGMGSTEPPYAVDSSASLLRCPFRVSKDPQQASEGTLSSSAENEALWFLARKAKLDALGKVLP